MGDGVADGGGETVDVGVSAMAVSVTGGGGVGDGVGEGKGTAVGKDSVGEGSGTAVGGIGDGRTLEASSRLNSTAPNNIPTLTNVMSRLPSTCQTPMARSGPECDCPSTLTHLSLADEPPSSSDEIGRIKLKVLPAPISLSTQIRPPFAST